VAAIDRAVPSARTGPGKWRSRQPTRHPWSEPDAPGIAAEPLRDRFVRSKAAGVPLPSSDDAIAFAPVTELSRWIEAGS
jgi:hypothetical protein